MRFVYVLLVGLLVMSPSAAVGQVVLNEMLADPAQDWDGDGNLHSRDDEWVEIFNAGTEMVDLTGYRLAGADTVWRFEFTGFLAPGAHRVVYGSDSYAWEKATGNPAFGLRLSNSGSELQLWRLTHSDSVLVDAYAYLDHEADDDRSSGRMPDGDPEWHLFDGLNAYENDTPPLGTGCMPSPGEVVSCVTPVRRMSWGSLKNELPGSEAGNR